MSFVAAVLESATQVDIDGINKVVPDLKQTVENYKNEAITNVENVLVKYRIPSKNRSVANDSLLNKVLHAQQTLTSLKEKAEYISQKNLIRTDRELNKNISALGSIEIALQIVLNLQKYLKLLDEFNTELAMHNYLACMDIIKELIKKVDNIPLDEQLEIMDELRLTILQKHLRLKNDLKNVFTDNIQVIDDTANRKTTLRVKKSNEDIKKVILALYRDTKEVYPLHSLARDLWDYFFIPIVDHEVELKETEDETFFTISLSIKNKEKKSKYDTVFENLKKLLKFLSKNFNYHIDNVSTALEYIGDDIRDNLSELIIKNCLRDTIPSTAEELQNYKVVIENTKQLENVLKAAKIFATNTTSILEYASNVDVLFINKKCGEYMNAATDIMKKELHEMIEVGVPFDPDYPLGHKILEFPQCCISKNVEELLSFCEKLLQKAVQTSPENCGRLFTTVTNILLKYRNFVPEYHKNYLVTLPQQIALFFNNCRYISHVLVEWNMKYCISLKPTLVECNFTEDSSQFSLLGLNMFNDYIEGQIKQINEIMGRAQLEGRTLEKLDPKTEKCVRQCLRQQELLRTVWHKVLPYNLYNKNMGIIVDILCKNIIVAVVKLEDITAKVAGKLVDVVKIVLIRAPKLFINPSEITLFVPSWYKLNELSFVLNASLADINDRWADGKGPLALQFEGNDLKQLIKALFQISDRRTAMLAKITDFSHKKT